MERTMRRRATFGRARLRRPHAHSSHRHCPSTSCAQCKRSIAPSSTSSSSPRNRATPSNPSSCASTTQTSTYCASKSFTVRGGRDEQNSSSSIRASSKSSSSSKSASYASNFLCGPSIESCNAHSRPVTMSSSLAFSSSYAAASSSSSSSSATSSEPSWVASARASPPAPAAEPEDAGGSAKLELELSSPTGDSAFHHEASSESSPHSPDALLLAAATTERPLNLADP
mmetsp:Transcript_1429/g.5268  ORF Transcript_1429/g.5268 Transcript_1429/m.5268 type:complete len:228 (-) Transcript_1429:154-837(-)